MLVKPLPRSLTPTSALLEAVGQGVDHILHAVRTHLGMDVGFISEFVGNERVFRHVDGDANDTAFKVGDADPLEIGYCQRVVDGRLPELIPDTARVAEAIALPITHTYPIGSHLSVPIRLHDGRVYGTFCCFSFQPDESLNERDLDLMRSFAALLSSQIETQLLNARAFEAKLERVRRTLECDALQMVYQPIFRLTDGHITGLECLARFEGQTDDVTHTRFAEAAEVGMGVELELRAIQLAVRDLRDLPGDFRVHLNLSPQTALSPTLPESLNDIAPHRLVLEITEHASVTSYLELTTALTDLRARGISIAIDDTGAGYASLRHILNLQPEVIKLDMSLSRGIDSDSRRRALAAAFIGFARETGSVIVAEGVESEEELRTLKKLGVEHVQGYHLGRPWSLEALRDILRERATLENGVVLES
jgi:EAL domain-containing protein (putative c-di-GMP-specific phosphodiesterase class I)